MGLAAAAELVGRGGCPDCMRMVCRCAPDVDEESPAAWRGPHDEWHDGKTGKIIPAARAKELLKDTEHETRSDEDDWRDYEE